MKCVEPVRLVLLLLTLTVPWIITMPSSKEPITTTRRSLQQLQIGGETIKQLTNQLINTNTTEVFDTRTPPKVKQQLKKPPLKKDEAKLENSHPGIAVPMEDTDLIEESTKKFNFYKIENKPTTDRGLSTWVLLNSQTVPPSSYTTTKGSRKPVMKHKNDGKNLTTIDTEIFNKITKPLFKKRPGTTTTLKSTTTTTTVVPEKEFKFTKIKASVLNNAINNKNKTKPGTTTSTTTTVTTTTTTEPNKKENAIDSDSLREVPTISPNSATKYDEIRVQSKDDEIELPSTTQTNKKNRRTTAVSKKKKNKNRRRRPSIDKSDTNSTKISNKLKDKPISTQIYNYLSREIMPTVGVGLVGLMVTAGLASYFLYPFGAARRSYDIDRKDKEGSYYYSDEYSPGGVAEEEVIGKVIAGMPAKDAYYRSPSSSLRYRQSDYTSPRKPQPHQAQTSVEAVYLTPSRNYDEDVHLRTQYSLGRDESHEEKQFVVGNVPTEVQDVTPAVVPEHGPRNLPRTTVVGTQGLAEIVVGRAPRSRVTRRRRSSTGDGDVDDSENEIAGRPGLNRGRSYGRGRANLGNAGGTSRSSGRSNANSGTNTNLDATNDNLNAFDSSSHALNINLGTSDTNFYAPNTDFVGTIINSGSTTKNLDNAATFDRISRSSGGTNMSHDNTNFNSTDKKSDVSANSGSTTKKSSSTTKEFGSTNKKPNKDHTDSSTSSRDANLNSGGTNINSSTNTKSGSTKKNSGNLNSSKTNSGNTKTVPSNGAKIPTTTVAPVSSTTTEAISRNEPFSLSAIFHNVMDFGYNIGNMILERFTKMFSKYFTDSQKTKGYYSSNDTFLREQPRVY